MPRCLPWTYHVDDHLQLINNHVFSGLCQHFQRGSQKARQAHISPEQWQAICVRRHARRLAARSRKLRNRELVAAVMRVWRHTPNGGRASRIAAEKTRRRYFTATLSEARLAKLIRGLTATVNKLIPDSSLHDQAVAALVGPGLLAQAGIPSGLEDFLRSHLRGTWFTLQPCPLEVQHTKSGTTPGSPLADILFQFAQSSFMRNVMQELDDCGLSARVTVSSDRAEPQGWADDVAVLLPMADASQIEGQLRKALPILDRQSRLIGIPLNYESGKSEALLSLRGAHSVKVRRGLLSDDVPQLSIHFSDTTVVQLRLVERYVHLGNVVTHSASSLAYRPKAHLPCLFFAVSNRRCCEMQSLAPMKRSC